MGKNSGMMRPEEIKDLPDGMFFIDLSLPTLISTQNFITSLRMKMLAKKPQFPELAERPQQCMRSQMGNRGQCVFDPWGGYLSKYLPVCWSAKA